MKAEFQQGLYGRGLVRPILAKCHRSDFRHYLRWGHSGTQQGRAATATGCPCVTPVLVGGRMGWGPENRPIKAEVGLRQWKRGGRECELGVIGLQSPASHFEQEPQALGERGCSCPLFLKAAPPPVHQTPPPQAESSSLAPAWPWVRR